MQSITFPWAGRSGLMYALTWSFNTCMPVFDLKNIGTSSLPAHMFIPSLLDPTTYLSPLPP